MSELAELRALPVDELHKRAADLRKDIETLRLKIRQGGGEHPHQIRQKKRHIARLLTLAQEQVRSAS